jgi:hypothetical protein
MISNLMIRSKADTRVLIAVPFGRASTEAMTGIHIQPVIAIPHRTNIVFDNGTDPESGEFPEDSAHAQSDPRSRLRWRAIRNAPKDLVLERSRN